MRARKARTHGAPHVSRWIYRLRSCGPICKVVLNLTRWHLQVHTRMSFCTTRPRTLRHSNTAHACTLVRNEKKTKKNTHTQKHQKYHNSPSSTRTQSVTLNVSSARQTVRISFLSDITHCIQMRRLLQLENHLQHFQKKKKKRGKAMFKVCTPAV